MLTRFVRGQLVIFGVVSVIGVLAMATVYMQVPTLLGIGRLTVKMELPNTGGLYRFSNVTMRGVQVGKVTDVSLTPTHVTATLSLDSSTRIPSDVQANVRSVSAVGEQYIDLIPRQDGGPYLRNGSVIETDDVDLPQQVGPMLDQASALLNSIPKDQMDRLVDETYKGLAGAGYDLGSLFDSSSTLSGDLNDAADHARSLTDGAVPLLNAQAETTDALSTWTRSLAGITEQVNQNEPDVRNLLDFGPGLAQEVSRLLDQVKPTLPVLLANLTSLGQVGVTYRPSIEQLLVMLPLTAAGVQSYAKPSNNPTGIPLSDFGISIADPPVCTVGFLPPSSWRPPSDTTETDTPDGLYCKLPQDSPISVRGARNSPCMEHPGKRAPTVEICNSDKPYVPLAMRQHALGPYPMDPNLISQGVPPDSRVTEDQHIYGPVGGTPLPPDMQPPGPTAPAPSVPPPPPAPPAPAPAPAAEPSSFDGNASTGPSVAVVPYNSVTGQYSTPDGTVARQSSLVNPARSWQEMLPR